MPKQLTSYLLLFYAILECFGKIISVRRKKVKFHDKYDNEVQGRAYVIIIIRTKPQYSGEFQKELTNQSAHVMKTLIST